MALASLELGDLSATIKSMYHHTQLDDYLYIFLYFLLWFGGIKNRTKQGLMHVSLTLSRNPTLSSCDGELSVWHEWAAACQTADKQMMPNIILDISVRMFSR